MENDEIKISNETEPIKITELPSPDFSGLPLDKYFTLNLYLIYRQAEIAIGKNVHSVHTILAANMLLKALIQLYRK